MMKTIQTLLTVLLLSGPTLAGIETEIQYLSGRGPDSAILWDFKVTKGRRANEWTTIPVPSNWELQGFGEYNYGHDDPKADEKGFYRHLFTVPANWAGMRISIVFEGSMTDTTVRINGKLAGPVHQGGFYRFEYDITELIEIGDENQLDVEVSKVSSNESINQAERQSDYWVFGGIFRPVYLKSLPKEYIDWTAIDAKADGSFGINVHLGFVEKADRVQAQIYELSGRALGSTFSSQVSSALSIAAVQTKVVGQRNWTAETPHLYEVELTLMDGQVPLHSIRERFGFRTIEVREGQGIFLNDEPIVLKGCNRHSFWPTTGRALSRAQCRDDILTMKEMNMNAVRMSHYPPDPAFLDLCDEMGMYVLDELAGWQKPPYDTPTGERLVKQIVRRDANHPSILFWDNGNEGGWNTDLDDEFGKWDPQNRRVLHPWGLFSGIDTDHYEDYESTLKKLQSGNIFMPTEYLHGLYDGGLGAGLEDFWNSMWGDPITGGMFLWVFADEGVVRTDLNGKLDTDGNHAPDGILGPFHERSASFHTIREVWSPVYIDSNWRFPDRFDGTIPVENRYDFTNLNRCSFVWKLVNYYNPTDLQIGHKEIMRKKIDGPGIPARAKGLLSLDLPDDWDESDALMLSAYDWNNSELWTWAWRISTTTSVVSRIVSHRETTPELNKTPLGVSAGHFHFSFDERTGCLIDVRQGSKRIPFRQGPRLVASNHEPTDQEVSFEMSESEGRVVLDVTGHTDFERLRWTVDGSGWLKLDFTYSHEGAVDYLGVSFDYPENRVNGLKWLGKGPYRVWKNRIKGGTVDVWFNTYKNYRTNTAWDYPEFVGYFADFNWAVLNTDDGPITIATETENLFFRVYSQEDGEDPRYASMIWPIGDISFLHAIPAIGTKFKPAERYGPMSQKFHASGSYQGTLYFYFGRPDLSSKP